MHTRFILPPVWILGMALLLAGCATQPLVSSPSLEAASLPPPRVVSQVPPVRTDPGPVLVRVPPERPAPAPIVEERLVVTAPPVRALPVTTPKPVTPAPTCRRPSRPPAFDIRACGRSTPFLEPGGCADLGPCAGGT